VRYITLPGLRYITFYVILTGIISSLQSYGNIMLISGGNPYGQTDVLAYRIYRDGFRNFNFGLAGAEAVILSVVIMVFAMIYFKFRIKDIEA
jgi:ABC-type sugar transport system permease subunit